MASGVLRKEVNRKEGDREVVDVVVGSASTSQSSSEGRRGVD